MLRAWELNVQQARCKVSTYFWTNFEHLFRFVPYYFYYDSNHSLHFPRLKLSLYYSTIFTLYYIFKISIPCNLAWVKFEPALFGLLVMYLNH